MCIRDSITAGPWGWSVPCRAWFLRCCAAGLPSLHIQNVLQSLFAIRYPEKKHALEFAGGHQMCIRDRHRDALIKNLKNGLTVRVEIYLGFALQQWQSRSLPYVMDLSKVLMRFAWEKMCIRDSLDAPPVVVGSRNWITPAHELEKFFFPQEDWIIDAIHERIMPIPGYTAVKMCIRDRSWLRLFIVFTMSAG